MIPSAGTTREKYKGPSQASSLPEVSAAQIHRPGPHVAAMSADRIAGTLLVVLSVLRFSLAANQPNAHDADVAVRGFRNGRSRARRTCHTAAAMRRACSPYSASQRAHRLRPGRRETDRQSVDDCNAWSSATEESEHENPLVVSGIAHSNLAVLSARFPTSAGARVCRPASSAISAAAPQHR